MQSPIETAENTENGRFTEGNTASRGRPKGSVSITAAIRQKLTERYPKASNREKRTYLEMIVKTILDKALEERDTATLKQIWSYMDGMPRTQMAIEVETNSLDEMTEFFRKAANPKENPA